MAEQTELSIIITNHNYASYLPAAIDSALEQGIPSLEVIVVDDGSTDSSRQVIEFYGDRVRAVYQENGGQPSAFNAGFAKSRGEVVIFLDSDDVLVPGIAGQCVEIYRDQPETTRVQYQMEVIDGEGKRTGVIKPDRHVPVPTGNLRSRVLAFPFDLPWLPTSGNAFSAKYLRQVFPIPAEEYGRLGADYYLVHLAPLFGPVEYIDRIGAYYRVHGRNNHELDGDSLDFAHLRQKIIYESITHKWIETFAAREAGSSPGARPAQNQSVSHLASCLISRKLDRKPNPLVQDRVWWLVLKGWRAAMNRFDVSLPGRILFAAWFLAVGLSPRGLSTWLAELFLFPHRRQRLNQLLSPIHQQPARKPQALEEDAKGLS